ncbi:hypothetical protein IV505_04435 [Pseudomonas fulva]|nr:hypothetical protein [Pseudomonas fulva]MBF8778986.1 hypothetical protein [Pseudomonas fulva]
MKFPLLLGLSFSVLAANALAMPADEQQLAAESHPDRLERFLPLDTLAEGGADRLIERNDRVAEGGADRLNQRNDRVAEGGADRLNQRNDRVAEGGADRLNQTGHVG